MTTDTAIFQEQRYKYLLDSMRPTPSFGLIAAALTVGIIFGASGYIFQLINGLSETNLNYRQFWGMYLVNFVFFIGISHAGTLISAILRVTGASWRAPVTRMAEAITVFSLIVGASMILIDMGQVWRIPNIILYFNLTSPILWDFLSVTTYLFGSSLFLFIPMIPDNALLRDYYREQLDFNTKQGIESPFMLRLRYKFHKILGLNWKGTETQVQRFDKAVKIMSLCIIPIAVSVHTVVSFVFSMHWRPGWHSSIFGPYFVVGAIFSGVGALLVAMALFRKMYHLEEFITSKQFANLAYLLLAFALMYVYFTVSEYLTAAYTAFEGEAGILQQIFYGQYAWGFWSFLIPGLIVPIVLLSIPRTRNSIFWVAVAGFLSVMGMWVKRFIIVVPTVAAPVYNGVGVVTDLWLVYNPSWVELGITLAGTCGFILFYMLFSKVFPIIAIYETHEYEQELAKEARMHQLYDEASSSARATAAD